MSHHTIDHVLSLPPISVNGLGVVAFLAVAIALGSAVVHWTTILRLYNRTTLRRQGYLVNSQGKSIPEIPENTRFTRFSHGSELSKRGIAEFGDEPYLVWNDGRAEIILSTPDHIKAFYGRQAREHGKPASGNMGDHFHRLMGDCVGVQNGQKWKIIRKVFDPRFSNKHAIAAMPKFESEILDWRRELGEKSNNQTSFIMEAVPICRILPFKLIAIALFGAEVMSDEMFKKLLDLNTVHERIMLRTFFGRNETSAVYNSLPTDSKKDMDSFLGEWKDYVMECIHIAERHDYESPAKELYPSVLNGTITEREFLQTVDEILFANLDVTSSILAFLLINLAAQEEAQEDLRQEIMSQIQIADEVGGEPLSTYTQKNTTMLEYTCMESIRLCPAAWFTLPEYAVNDLDVGGYRIKGKTPCIIDWNRLNTESPIWWPEKSDSSSQLITGKSFYPRRFLAISPADYRWSLLRFGLGGRQCLGKNFGSVMMKQFLIDTLSHYKLELSGPPREDMQGIKGELRKDRFTITSRQYIKFTKI